MSVTTHLEHANESRKESDYVLRQVEIVVRKVVVMLVRYLVRRSAMSTS